ncbi:MAG TPA: DUF998 domain-containing protein [Acidimicrobiia bacterium]|jgi:hypothetical protein|nr:DUF998 domain-containing protein [Acidimicrobiia bacterium]
MRARRFLGSIAGPGAFATAAFVGARREPGYRPHDEPISALAAHGSRAASVMVPGFFALAGGTIAFARALRGSAAAPTPVPQMLTVVGLAVAGAGIARCSDPSCPARWLGDDVQLTDDLHVAISAVAFAGWAFIPLIAAARARNASARYRRWSAVLGATTLATMIGGGRFQRNPNGEWSGTAQRVTLASAFAWYALAGLSG